MNRDNENSDVYIVRHSSSGFRIKSGKYYIDFHAKDTHGLLTFSRVDRQDTHRKMVTNFCFSGDNISVFASPKEITVEESDNEISVRLSANTDWAEFILKLRVFKRSPGLINWSLSMTAFVEGGYFQLTEPELAFYDFVTDNFIQTRVINFLAGSPATYSAASRQDRWGGFAFIYDEDILTSTILYHEDYTPLNDYFVLTKTKPDFSVVPLGVSWGPPNPKSDIVLLSKWGYIIPQSSQNIPPHTNINLLNTFLYLCPEKPENSCEYCELFLRLFSDIYDYKEKPPVIYTDWIDQVVPQMITDLLNEKNWVERDGYSYIKPYVDAIANGHASGLVTLTSSLVPLHFYFDKYGKGRELYEKLRQGLPNYYFPNFENIKGSRGVIWNGLATSDSNIDTWYFYFPIIQVGELALWGDEIAKDMFLGTIRTAMDLAQALDYIFPKFVNVKTFERVVRRGDVSSFGNQYDVTGAYVYLMLQCFELTGKWSYVKEAERAAKKINEMGFEYMYEAHITALGPSALLKLYRLTGNKTYIRMSYIPLSNIIRQSWLWECEYEWAKDYGSFFLTSATPANAIANGLEEQNIWKYLEQYYEMGNDYLPDFVKKLVAELLKYKINGFRTSLPPFLPKEAFYEPPLVAGRKIYPTWYIPLEGISPGWNKSGDLGHSIYSTGGPIILATELYHFFNNGAIVLYTEYPSTSVSWDSGKLFFTTGGVSSYNYGCKMWIDQEVLGIEEGKEIALYEGGSLIDSLRVENGMIEFQGKGGCYYSLDLR